MGVQLGKYELLRSLASGGMAEVFLAQAVGPEQFLKTVAIKRIRRHLAGNDTFIKMFLDEARLVARLTHPNIVQVFDLGEADGDYFVAMEYVHGRNVANVLSACQKRGTSLPLDMALKIASLSADALGYAHALTRADGTPIGIIHRDVSPHNIMLSYDGTVKVVDFGIAKAATNLHETQVSSLKGKVPYMSPEQLSQNVALDQRTDIFSLGVTLFEMICGERPFSGDNELALMNAIVHDDAPDPRALVPDLPADLARILTRMLEKDRSHRFATAHEVHRELERVLMHRAAVVDSRTLGELLRELLPPETPEPTFGRAALWSQAAAEETASADTVVSGRGASVAQPAPAPSTARLAPESADPALSTEAREQALGRSRRGRTWILSVLLVAIATGAIGLAREVWEPAPDGAKAPQREPPPVALADEPVTPAPVPADEPVTPALVPADEPITPPVALADEPVTPAPVPADEPVTPALVPADEPVTPALVPADEPVTTPSAVSGADPSSAARRSRDKGKRRRAKARTGVLRVQTRPPTEVLVNNRSRGRTPWSEPLELQAGRYLVEMRDAELGIHYRQSVELKPGGSIMIDKSFGQGALQVFAQPYGEVLVDGKSQGLTPLDGPIPLYEGRHVVRVLCERTAKETTRRVTIRAGKTKRLNVDLR